MRHYLFLALALTGACKWTDFDDLEETTGVRSTQEPDIGSTDYAVAIAGVSTGTSGGLLAVISDDTANYSTIEYDRDGGAAVGANPIKLGEQKIGAIAETPAFTYDATGRVGIVERSINGGNFAVVFGSATAPAGTEFLAMAQPAPAPDAALFIPNAGGTSDFLFVAGSTFYKVPSTGSATPTACTAMDNATPTPMGVQVAAMNHDGTNLWVWTKSGSLISYPLSAFSTGGLCETGSIGTPNATSFTPATAFMPAGGARVHVSGNFAVLTGSIASSRNASVFVVNLTTGAQVGSTLNVDGMKTSAFGAIDGTTYLVVGVPDRSVDGVAAGEVDLHAFDTTAGTLDASPALSLRDSDPESGALFGRAVTMMNFNGNAIVVVAAKSEVYAYYRTTLYDHQP